jgi:hypothetical protein
MPRAFVAALGYIVAAAGLLILGAGTELWLVVEGILVFAAGIGVVVPSMVEPVLERANDSGGSAAALYAATAFLGASLALAVGSLDLAFETLVVVLAGGLTLAAVLVRRDELRSTSPKGDGIGGRSSPRRGDRSSGSASGGWAATRRGIGLR